MNFNSLYPELLVECLARSRFFYEEILGFDVEYERPEEHFLYLSLNGGAQIMLLQDNGNHHSQTGPMHYPRGQGVNFSILCEQPMKSSQEYPFEISGTGKTTLSTVKNNFGLWTQMATYFD